MESACVNRCWKHIKTGLYKKRNIFVVFCNKKALETLPFSIPIYYVDRDVSTGATGATEVAPKFWDTLTLLQPGGADFAHHCRSST